MSDNKDKQGKQDRMRVDANDASEVEYLHRQYPQYSHTEILNAVKEQGPLRQDIERFLSSKKK
jgi:hypothetical protein